MPFCDMRMRFKKSNINIEGFSLLTARKQELGNRGQ